tara:strand:+ start:1073 stop:1369 length:297 start_codon:yes stop_codon:yes gene_type:complete
VLFLENGASIKDPETKSFKLNVNKFINKYALKVSKFLSARPKALLDAQERFNERAYAELLEACSDKINKKRKNLEDKEKYFTTLFTIDGKQMSTISDI